MISDDFSGKSLGVPQDYDFTLTPSIRRLKLISSDLPWYKHILAARKRPVYEFTEDYYYRLPCGIIGWIPSGFTTDFASLPRILFLIPGLTPTGALMIGSIPHDFGYRHNRLLNPRGEWIYCEVGQRAFDTIMRDINIRDEHSKVLSWIAFIVLRAVGSVAWKNNRKRDKGCLDLRGEYG